MSNKIGVASQFKYGQTDHADDPVTVYAGPVLLRAAHVTEQPDDTVGIDDGTTADVFVIPAGTGVGTKIDYGDVKLTTSLIADYGGSATAGKVTFVYVPEHEGLAGDGA